MVNNFFATTKWYPNESPCVFGDKDNNNKRISVTITKYLSKLNDNGVLILEGGSKERDQIDWMKKYNKPQIQPVLCKYKNDYNILTIGTVPSITLIQRN